MVGLILNQAGYFWNPKEIEKKIFDLKIKFYWIFGKNRFNYKSLITLKIINFLKILGWVLHPSIKKISPTLNYSFHINSAANP